MAKLYELTSAIEKAPPSPSRSNAIHQLMLLVAPMVPHIAEEAWAKKGVEAGFDGLIADASWPEVDAALLIDDEMTIAVQVNGKLRDTLTLPKDMPREAVETAALASDKIVRILEGKAPKKVIVVPGRLVNIVA